MQQALGRQSHSMHGWQKWALARDPSEKNDRPALSSTCAPEMPGRQGQGVEPKHNCILVILHAHVRSFTVHVLSHDSQRVLLAQLGVVLSSPARNEITSFPSQASEVQHAVICHVVLAACVFVPAAIRCCRRTKGEKEQSSR